jgi:hypothetical protein
VTSLNCGCVESPSSTASAIAEEEEGERRVRVPGGHNHHLWFNAAANRHLGHRAGTVVTVLTLLFIYIAATRLLDLLIGPAPSAGSGGSIGTSQFENIARDLVNRTLLGGGMMK